MPKAGYAYCSDTLASESHKEIMVALSRRFNNPDWVGIESRLTTGGNRADYMFYLTKVEGLRLIQDSRSGRASVLARRSGLIPWVMENASLSNLVEGYWLEYDLEGVHPVASLSDPLFFIVFQPWHYGFDLLVELLRQLLPKAGKQPQVVQDKLYECIRQMERGVQLYAIGFMESRSPDKLRLVLRADDRERLWWYLERTGWRDWERIRTSLADLTKIADHFLVHVDLEPGGICPRLGLELVVQPPGEQQKIASMLQVLERHNLCLSAKKQAVLDWPGSYRADGALWDRYVNYLKVQVSGSMVQEAKAYLFYRKVPPGGNHPST